MAHKTKPPGGDRAARKSIIFGELIAPRHSRLGVAAQARPFDRRWFQERAIYVAPAAGRAA